MIDYMFRPFFIRPSSGLALFLFIMPC